MVSDRVIGAGILVASIVLIIIYLAVLIISPALNYKFILFSEQTWQLFETWLIRITIFAAVGIIGAIAAWIGWTILTTPPPKPIEEIEKELEAAVKETQPPQPPEKK